MNVIYCRSSEWHVGKVSLSSQVGVCHQEAAKKELTIPDDHVLLEQGVSGRDLNRPKMAILLEWIKSGKLDNGHLFVPSYDRLTRVLGDLTYLLELFDEHSIHVHSAKEKIPENMTSSVRSFYIHSLGAIAQNYLETCRDHALVTIERRRKEGKPLGAAPYGYKHIGDTFSLISEEAETVALIFNLYLSGFGYKKICKELTKRGLLFRERPFKETDIYRILGNQTYAGTLGKGETSYKGNHQAIISMTDFENVQQIRQSKQQEKVHFLDYPLHRKLLCHCGWHVSTYTYDPKKGQLRRYYVCANPVHRENGYPIQLPADTLERQVAKLIRQFLTNHNFIHQLVHQIEQEQHRLEQVETKRLITIKRQRDQLFSDYENNVIHTSDFSERLKQLKEEKMKQTQKYKVITMEDLSTLILTEDKLGDDFFFNLVQRVELSDSNELIGLYLEQLPEYNLIQWREDYEATSTVS